MSDTQDSKTFGVFKPVGHVVVSFPSADDAAGAERALRDSGTVDADIHAIGDREMVRRLDDDLAHASSLAAIGQEMNLAKAQRVLAERGYHFLIVRYHGDDDAQRIADVCSRFNAERAQRYGRFVIEELIEHPDDLPQVAESPDRGLDAQTPSGREAERTVIRGDDDPRD